MKLSPAGGTLLLLALGTSLAASLPSQSQSPAASAKNSARHATQSVDAAGGKRKIPCKTWQNASLCYWTHGRLAAYNGNPTYRIWKIGTRRILGVFNGPSHFPPRIASFDDDVFSPEFPETLNDAYKLAHDRWEWSWPPDVFADFEVCPLEPEKKEWMQAVFIESAKNIFIPEDD